MVEMDQLFTRMIECVVLLVRILHWITNFIYGLPWLQNIHDLIPIPPINHSINHSIHPSINPSINQSARRRPKARASGSSRNEWGRADASLFLAAAEDWRNERQPRKSSLRPGGWLGTTSSRWGWGACCPWVPKPGRGRRPRMLPGRPRRRVGFGFGFSVFSVVMMWRY